MKLITTLILLLASLSFSHAEILEDGPFEGVDLSKIKTKTEKIIKEANEDFLSILEFKYPKHAKKNTEAPLPFDGGTSYWVGDGYDLTILKSLSSFGDLHGYIYGPIILFWDDFAPGNTNRIESLKFYNSHELPSLPIPF